MLVLSRKKDEKIVINKKGEPPITITIVKIDNKNKVRVGIDASNEYVVLRSELEEKPHKVKEIII